MFTVNLLQLLLLDGIFCAVPICRAYIMYIMSFYIRSYTYLSAHGWVALLVK